MDHLGLLFNASGRALFRVLPSPPPSAYHESMEDRKAPEEEELDFGEPGPERGRRTLPTVTVLAGVVVALVAVFLYFGGRKEGADTPAPEPVPARVEREAVPVETPPQMVIPPEAMPEDGPEEPPAPAPIVPPPLDESDKLVRGFAGRLSSDGFPASWLASEDFIRRFVVAVDNIADGSSPRNHMSFVKIRGEFAVMERWGRVYLDPAGYRRYDGFADVAAGVDAVEWARLYHELHPLFQEAYDDLGYPDRQFDDTLGRAIGRLLGTPVVEGDILLMSQEGAYYFEDPALEGLDGAEKHLLRMGPANTRKIQGLLRALEAALEGVFP